MIIKLLFKHFTHLTRNKFEIINQINNININKCSNAMFPVCKMKYVYCK